ncbi:MAG: hypothetical protein EOP40_11495 [Rubrivivax sp.]|nr:MAG: hypothetical protein EOP40_11495 [Rubrivivax sp.]
MERANGDALEWALALLRAPSERHALRERPLPAGMERLLGIAAGISSEASAQAARTLGESEANLRDAARFYAREVLFFPRADAYRVLGLHQGAANDTIKSHHRLLQQWLHPDRAHGEDSVFSARVNSAWNHLRTEERRQAYDQALRDHRPPEIFDSSGALRRVPGWTASPAELPPPTQRSVRRLALLALIAACAVLLWLTARDDSGQQPDAWADLLAQEQAPNRQADGFDIHVPERRAETHATNRKQESAAQQQRAKVSRKALIAQQGNPPPRIVTDVRAPKAAIPTVVAVASDTQRSDATDTMQPVAIPARPGAGMTPVVLAAAAPVEASPMPVPPPIHRPAPVPQPDTSPPSAPPAASGETPASSAEVLFARTQLARQAGDQLIRYLNTRNRPPPPIWNSPSIQAGADRLRNDLHQAGRARVSAPEWRVAREAAAFTARYRIDGSDNRSGVVSADLAWREGRWLVTGVSMERPR